MYIGRIGFISCIAFVLIYVLFFGWHLVTYTHTHRLFFLVFGIMKRRLGA